jgi:hypothetical protein
MFDCKITWCKVPPTLRAGGAGVRAVRAPARGGAPVQLESSLTHELERRLVSTLEPIK